MERLQTKEQPKAMDLLSQGWAILFNPETLGLGFGSAVTQVSCQHQLSSPDRQPQLSLCKSSTTALGSGFTVTGKS